jgi:trk system potassium uptake protein TrkH
MAAGECSLRMKDWSVHLRLTVFGTLLLLAVGCALFGDFE